MDAVNKITTHSTSKNHAICNDIVLRANDTARLIFRPELVNNQNDPSACVRGTFIYQRKGTNESWNDYKTLDLSKLKKSEWIKLVLKSSELKQLIASLNGNFNIFQKYGIQWGDNEYIPTTKDIASIMEAINQDSDFLASFIQKGGLNVLPEIIKWLSETEDTKELISKLQELNLNQLEKVHNLIGISNIKSILTLWEENKQNSDEEFWQKTLEENSWIISQLFAAPLIIFNDKAYMGGKGIENTGGQIADFIYQNQLTNNIAIIEIKTPSTELIEDSEYRNNIYPTSKELSGGIIQVLSQKQNILNNYFQIVHDSKKEFRACSPKCILIIGSFESKNYNIKQIESFDNFRNNIENVNIITFDELFRKAEILIALFEGDQTKADSDNKVPF